MPTINKLPKREKSTYHSNTDMRELRRKAYNLTAWKKLREKHLKEHPLCEECLRKGRIRPASHVHHIMSPFRYGRVDYQKFLNEDNLESICPVCHSELHNKEHGYIPAEEMVRILDEIMAEVEDDNSGSDN